MDSGAGAPTPFFGENFRVLALICIEIGFPRNTAHFAIVSTVHAPRIARKRATYRFLRLEMRNTVQFRMSESDLSFSRYNAVTNGFSRDFAFYVILQQQAAKCACIAQGSRHSSTRCAHSMHCTLVGLAHGRNVGQKFCTYVFVRIE